MANNYYTQSVPNEASQFAEAPNIYYPTVTQHKANSYPPEPSRMFFEECESPDCACHGAFIPKRSAEPQTETFEEVFKGIFKEAYDLLVERQHKYGPENIKQLGLYGVFSRLASDKIERLRRSFNGKVIHGEIILDSIQDFSDESVDDALLDVANYALIMLALKRGVWGRPLADEVK